MTTRLCGYSLTPTRHLNPAHSVSDNHNSTPPNITAFTKQFGISNVQWLDQQHTNKAVGVDKVHASIIADVSSLQKNN